MDVSVKRVGGGYGSKLTRANFIAAGCALGAHKTRRYVGLLVPYIHRKLIMCVNNVADQCACIWIWRLI